MIAIAYYLLKVIICSGVLFLYYHIALRNKLFHQWNRFYLLISVFISLVAPVIQVSIMHQISDEPNRAIQMLQVLQSADGYLEEVTIRGHQGFSTDQWLMIIYIMVSVILFLSVLLSLRKIISIIRSHTIQWVEKIKFINTNAQGTPFSFFNFIFWNEDINLQTKTGQQIFQHELVHVKEKHTLDKLFVQLILILFWYNPFFWLIRKELKLIHEFIADKKAVGEHGSAALAAMILSSSYPAQFNSITNQFFQTSIKRRLAMLTKIQNVKLNYISRILALPILAITVLAFTLRTKTVNVSSIKLDKQITVVIDAGHGINPDGTHNGAKEENVYEDDITLAIAKKIQELNTNEKIKIVLTRSSNEIVDLHKRVEIAKENYADLFISLHVNAADPTQNPDLSSNQSLHKGFEIYVSGKGPAYQQQSELLGSVLQQELNTVYYTNQYLLKRKVGVWVLDQNICPSVLVECGFLTDDKDREFITKGNNQTAVAQKILQAIESYAANQQTFQKISDDTTPKISNVIIENKNSSTQENTKKLDLKLSSQNPPLYFLDGKEVNKEDVDKIDPAAIESINVYKGTAATNKYGKDALNGVIEITSKSNSNQNSNSGTLDDNNNLALNYFQSNQLIIVDGEEVAKDEINKMDPSAIESISVLKGKSAIDKYGKKGTNGAIEIKLKTSKIINEVTINPVSNDTIPKTRSFDDPALPQLKLSQISNLKSIKQLNQSNVVRFQIVCPEEKGFTTHMNEGAEFDEATRLMLNKSKLGDIVTFEKIIIIENGKEIKRPGLIFGITQ